MAGGKNIWFRPEVLPALRCLCACSSHARQVFPLFLAVGAGVVICAGQCFRTFYTHNDVQYGNRIMLDALMRASVIDDVTG